MPIAWQNLPHAFQNERLGRVLLRILPRDNLLARLCVAQIALERNTRKGKFACRFFVWDSPVDPTQIKDQRALFLDLMTHVN